MRSAFDVQTRVLEQMDVADLQAKIRQSLAEDGGSRFWFLDRDSNDREILVRLFRNSTDRVFLQRFQTALSELLGQPEISDPDRLVYAFNLIRTIGDCRVTQAIDRLIALADGRFEGATFDGDDLHGLVLSVLLGLEYRYTELRGLFMASFDNPRYSAICYRALSLIDRRNVIRLLPTLTRQAERSPDLIDYDYMIYSVVGVANRDAVFSRLPSFFMRLTESQYNLLLTTLLDNQPVKSFYVDLEKQQVDLSWNGRPSASFVIPDENNRMLQFTMPQLERQADRVLPSGRRLILTNELLERADSLERARLP